jgi:hypothetical protein
MHIRQYRQIRERSSRYQVQSPVERPGPTESRCRTAGGFALLPRRRQSQFHMPIPCAIRRAEPLPVFIDVGRLPSSGRQHPEIPTPSRMTAGFTGVTYSNKAIVQPDRYTTSRRPWHRDPILSVDPGPG